MGFSTTYLTESMLEFIKLQKMFFVATAPLTADGKVNVSPKGVTNTFAVIHKNKVCYLDYTGSGVETIAHIKENGRMTLMMCSYTEKPNILRMYGTGKLVEAGSPEFEELFAEYFEEGGVTRGGARGIITLDIVRTSDSCGGGVPFYTFEKDRPTIAKWNAEMAKDGKMRAYWKKKNLRSIDDLEGIDPALVDQTQFSKRRSRAKPTTSKGAATAGSLTSFAAVAFGAVVGYFGPILYGCAMGADSCPF